ncbi:MAG: glycosyltransferase family 1 protein [Bacteroidota bacterium]|nr:glycosyltransferase family 1 protein [Bacteroidota bacterium]
MMKIGFDAKRFFYNSRGLGNYSRDTIRILSTLQPTNEYFLFTPKTANALPVTIGPNCRIVKPGNRLSRISPTLWRTYRECADINRLQLDIFHGLSHELPVGIEKTKARTVVTMHDVIFLKSPQLYSLIDRNLYKSKYLRSSRVADKIIAISEQTKTDLIELAHVDEKKIEVVYQGCNPIFCQTADNETKRLVKEKYGLPDAFLLNVGTVETRKNQALIIKALACEKLNIPLVIVGTQTDYIHELKALIKKEQLDTSVHFLANVPTLDLPAIYQLSTLFIYPSQLEGFGIPILEALNSRIPVITSKGSCFAETGGPATRYVDPTNAEELADVLKELLGNQEKRNNMIKRGLIHAQQFSDEAISKALFSVYQSLL